tara:strand:+ start:446 stop:1009 length:564 start_codon:yes stop_codon:yes gene_type:complete
MSSKKLIIYEYDTLFNILNEIKENCNFEIIKADKKNFDNLKKDLNLDFLIISKNKEDSSTNYLDINETPIKVNKLLELINIKFLRNKFNLQSVVKIGPYDLNLNSRQISKKEKKLNLTEREANLIVYLNRSSLPVKIEELQKEVWGYNDKLETHTVETHIYRLRKKIKENFHDESFIINLKDGYKIN